MKTYAYAALAAVILFAGSVVLFLTLISPRDDGGGVIPGSDDRVARSDGPGGSVPPIVGADPPRTLPVDPSPPTTGRSGKQTPGNDRSQPTDTPDKAPRALEPRPLPDGGCVLVIATLDAADEPVPGVRITLRSGLSAEEVVTGDEGEGVFADISAGIYSFVVDAPERPPLESARQVTLAEGEEKRLALHLGDFKMSISGRVLLDPGGSPVAGIEVTAVKHLVQPGEGALVSADRGQRFVTTDDDGYFEVSGLEEGDYELRTVASPEYPAVSKVVRAGTDSVNLAVRASVELRVFGLVSDLDDRPVADVRIIPLGQSARATRSDKDGSYELLLLVTNPKRIYTIRYLKDGYRELLLNVPGDDGSGAEEARVDATLDLEGESVAVTGVVRTSDDEPVSGETLHLQSQRLNARYQAASDKQGRFLFSDVQVGRDYRLWIHPRGPYQDYIKKSIQIGGEGTEIDVVLKPMGTGRLSGRMVDPDGKPLPRFSLWLRSTKAAGKAVQVTGDDAGLFVVEDAPEGRLVFETRSMPRLIVSGILLEADADKEVQLVLDWGEHKLSGRVVDQGGEPISGAQIYLSWTFREAAIRGSSMRKALADERGHFEFTQLGSGEHKLNVSAVGHRSARQTHRVGKGSSEVSITLQRTSQ